MITVSVVLPTYRNDTFLKRAIDSLVNQTYNNFELIIIDDNANIKWNNKVNNIVSQYINLIDMKLIVNIENKGSAKSRNIGIEQAKGKYITFLDDDDFYFENKIKKQVNCIIENNADFCISNLDIYDVNENLVRQRKHNYLINCSNILVVHLKYHLTGTDTLMFNSDYLRIIGSFDEIDMGDEFYLVLKAILNNGKLCYLPECLAKAYVHSSGIGISAGPQKESGENLLYERKKEFFSILSKRDIRYIKMRHYLVLTSCGLRKKEYIKVIYFLFKCLFSSPIEFLRFCIHRGEY